MKPVCIMQISIHAPFPKEIYFVTWRLKVTQFYYVVGKFARFAFRPQLIDMLEGCRSDKDDSDGCGIEPN